MVILLTVYILFNRRYYVDEYFVDFATNCIFCWQYSILLTFILLYFVNTMAFCQWICWRMFILSTKCILSTNLLTNIQLPLVFCCWGGVNGSAPPCCLDLAGARARRGDRSGIRGFFVCPFGRGFRGARHRIWVYVSYGNGCVWINSEVIFIGTCGKNNHFKSRTWGRNMLPRVRFWKWLFFQHVPTEMTSEVVQMYQFPYET